MQTVELGWTYNERTIEWRIQEVRSLQRRVIPAHIQIIESPSFRISMRLGDGHSRLANWRSNSTFGCAIVFSCRSLISESVHENCTNLRVSITKKRWRRPSRVPTQPELRLLHYRLAESTRPSWNNTLP